LPTKKSPDLRRRDLVREATLVGALAIELLLVVALVVNGPNPRGDTHLIGVVGRFLAAVLYTGFGIVSFVLLALAMYVTALALVRKSVTAARMRAVGVVLLLVGACSLVHQLMPTGYQSASGGRPAGYLPGGLVGELTYAVLRWPFGTFGGFVLSVVLLCTGFAFATDWLLYEMAFDGLKRLAGAGSLVSRFWPKAPVLATAGARSAAIVATPEPPTKPTRAELSAQTATAVLDEEDEAESDEPVAAPEPEI